MLIKCASECLQTGRQQARSRLKYCSIIGVRFFNYYWGQRLTEVFIDFICIRMY